MHDAQMQEDIASKSPKKIERIRSRTKRAKA